MRASSGGLELVPAEALFGRFGFVEVPMALFLLLDDAREENRRL
jgi:hypothetical protein